MKALFLTIAISFLSAQSFAASEAVPADQALQYLKSIDTILETSKFSDCSAAILSGIGYDIGEAEQVFVDSSGPSPVIDVHVESNRTMTGLGYSLRYIFKTDATHSTISHIDVFSDSYSRVNKGTFFQYNYVDEVVTKKLISCNKK